jgi:hypothetical protein
MDDLAAADDVIGVGTELLGEMGVGRLEFMDAKRWHGFVYIWVVLDSQKH